MNPRGNLIFVGVLSACLGAANISTRPARADDEATEQARQHYQEAQKQFDLGAWDAAIREFTKAYELRPDPTFLYNMAQAYRRSGNPRRAIDLYKNYLIKVPKSPQRREVEDRIQALQRQLDEEDRASKHAPVASDVPAPSPPSLVPPPTTQAAPLPAAVAAPPPQAAQAEVTQETAAPIPPAAPAAPPTIAPPSSFPVEPSPRVAAMAVPPEHRAGSRGLRIAGIVTGSVGVAALGAGLFFSLRTRSLSNSVGAASSFNPADAQSGRQAATLQWVGYGVGAAAVVTGAALYWAGSPRMDEKKISFAPMLAPDGAGIAASGTF